MRRFRNLALLAVALALAVSFPHHRAAPLRDPREPAREPLGEGGPGSDWFFMQRAYPVGAVSSEKFDAAVEQARVDRAASELSTSTAGLVWQQAGPYNIGGRVTALAVLPGGATIYLGAANGGVFKSTNSGVNWTPVFDPWSVYSIGALAYDPSNWAKIYVGTGESNSSVDSYDGAGVFISRNAGASWGYLGLQQTRRISRVAVDPADSNRIFAAAMGTQFSTGPDRGLYRSLDGGQTWSKVLFVSDSTGCTDVVFNPAHPETMFCATWERIRRSTYRRAYGAECGIWRSADHGSSWTKLAGGLPASSDNMGRIALAISRSRPSTIYAQITSGTSGPYIGLGLYRSDNGGTTWVRKDVTNFTNDFGGFGWYFGDMAVDPTNAEKVYCLGTDLVVSTNGGANFTSIAGYSSGAHPDQHALWIDPSNPARIYLGCDGGFFWTIGAGWNQSLDLPISQFYGGAIDPSNPSRLLGGTQDNGSLQTSGSPTGWTAMGIGGDGFQCLVDPTNPQVTFGEYQFCSNKTGLLKSTNGGLSFNSAGGFSSAHRYNWSTPIAMDPQDHMVLLVGANVVYRSTDNGSNYTVISPDLTRNIPSALTYSTISTLDVSPVNSLIYYVGTDDGRVWRTTSGGGGWTDITAGLPIRYVTRVVADPLNDQVVYCTLSGFGMDEHLAHVYRSANRGDTWASISGNLPDVPANDIVVDASDTNRLYLATDVGVYTSRDLGGSWYPLGFGMPFQTIFDLNLHQASRTLVAATHGRSQWKLDLTQMPVGVPPVGPGARLSLSAPAPNPSRGPVRFSLELPAATTAEVTIYDAAGRRVRALFKGSVAAGTRALAWDGRDEFGRRAGAGIYFARASAPGVVRMQRVVRVE